MSFDEVRYNDEARESSPRYKVKLDDAVAEILQAKEQLDYLIKKLDVILVPEPSEKMEGDSMPTAPSMYELEEQCYAVFSHALNLKERLIGLNNRIKL